jgi:hypothetical protein
MILKSESAKDALLQKQLWVQMKSNNINSEADWMIF